MENVQRYTFYTWLDADNVIRYSGMCPTDGLGDFPNWDRPGLRYVESDLGEITSEETHYYDPDDGLFYRREPRQRAAIAPLDLPPMPRRMMMP
jgi:hypothetical protein